MSHLINVWTMEGQISAMSTVKNNTEGNLTLPKAFIFSVSKKYVLIIDIQCESFHTSHI